MLQDIRDLRATLFHVLNPGSRTDGTGRVSGRYDCVSPNHFGRFRKNKNPEDIIGYRLLLHAMERLALKLALPRYDRQHHGGSQGRREWHRCRDPIVSDGKESNSPAATAWLIYFDTYQEPQAACGDRYQ